MVWSPHVTVAVVCENDGNFLFVEEISHGKTVINQPAGHIEKDELIQEAAYRETMEETGWKIELESLIGLYTYQSPINQTTYYRYCFAAKPIKQVTTNYDKDIIQPLWLSRQEVLERQSQLRSPLVIQCIDDYLANKRYPLTIINEEYRFIKND